MIEKEKSDVKVKINKRIIDVCLNKKDFSKNFKLILKKTENSDIEKSESIINSIKLLIKSKKFDSEQSFNSLFVK